MCPSESGLGPNWQFLMSGPSGRDINNGRLEISQVAIFSLTGLGGLDGDLKTP
ncbi:MAG: hypothetical protein ACE5NA_10015 [Nitrospiraceae bacterium]